LIDVAMAIVAIAAVLAAGELGARRFRLSGELARKLVHAGSGIVAATLPLLVSYGQIVAIALISAAVMTLAHRFRLLSALEGVERESWGEVWFPLGIAALAALFPHRPYVYGALVLGLADATAALVGVRFGRRRLPLVAGKTLWGSGAFYAAAVLIGFVVAGELSPWVLAAAAALTAAEAVTSGGADNVVIPVLAGLLGAQVWA
jgi:phytol kinase